MQVLLPIHPSICICSGVLRYTLAPNPNNGTFTIHANADNYEPITADVVNAIGMSVYRGTLHFTGNDAAVALDNAVPGMYIVRLTDARNQKYTFKFVVR